MFFPLTLLLHVLLNIKNRKKNTQNLSLIFVCEFEQNMCLNVFKHYEQRELSQKKAKCFCYKVSCDCSSSHCLQSCNILSIFCCSILILVILYGISLRNSMKYSFFYYFCFFFSFSNWWKWFFGNYEMVKLSFSHSYRETLLWNTNERMSLRFADLGRRWERRKE